jgi:hypothetical protein
LAFFNYRTDQKPFLPSKTSFILSKPHFPIKNTIFPFETHQNPSKTPFSPSKTPQNPYCSYEFPIKFSTVSRGQVPDFTFVELNGMRLADPRAA